MAKTFYNWLYWFMKVKITTATEDECDQARTIILQHVLYTKTISTECIKECITSHAFLMLYKGKDESNSALWPVTVWPQWKDIEAVVNSEDDEEISHGEMIKLYRYILKPRVESDENQNNVLGTIIKVHAKQAISKKYEFIQLDAGIEEDVQERFKKIMFNYANKCTYERSGDVYIHLLLRGKLNSRVNALIPSGNQPYDAISNEYKNSANDLVRPYIETPPSRKILDVKWEQSIDVDGFHFIVGLLREIIDGLACIVHVNSHICHCVCEPKVPHFVLFSMDFDIGIGVAYGFVYEDQMYLPPKSATPLLDFFILYISKCFASGLQDVKDIHSALFSPNSLSASSAFNVLLE